MISIKMNISHHLIKIIQKISIKVKMVEKEKLKLMMICVNKKGGLIVIENIGGINSIFRIIKINLTQIFI